MLFSLQGKVNLTLTNDVHMCHILTKTIYFLGFKIAESFTFSLVDAQYSYKYGQY